MSAADVLLGLAIGGAVGALAVHLFYRPRLGDRDAALAELKPAVDAARSKAEDLQERLREAVEAKARADGITAATLQNKDDEVARLLKLKEESVRELLAAKDASLLAEHRAKDAGLAEQKKLLEQTERVLTEKFGAVSMKSLSDATEQFLKLANETFSKSEEASKADLELRQKEIEHMLEPLAETLDKIEAQHKDIEEKRATAFDRIEKGIWALSQEADQLANALRKPTSRGAWGEMQLQVILENAGMVEGQHFSVQHSSEGEEGRQRTDVILHMPRGRMLVIDSKTPLESFWDGMNEPDEATRQVKFGAHARLVREHVKKLGNKNYWSRYPTAPDCVVMFIPTEGAYQAAFETDRSLLSDAHTARVYVANPMTLISMVHIAAYVLNEEKLRDNAHEVRSVGIELYKRLSKFLGDLDGVGRHLKLAVGEYNKAIGSVDGRLLPQARRMKELGASVGDMPVLETIDADPRSLSSPERLALEPLAADALFPEPLLPEIGATN